jgi:hypothetical protein
MAGSRRPAGMLSQRAVAPPFLRPARCRRCATLATAITGTCSELSAMRTPGLGKLKNYQ